MTIFALFIWGVFLWMARSVWRMRALPLWRRGLPLALLAGSGTSWIMAAELGHIAPLHWLSTALCPTMALAGGRVTRPPLTMTSAADTNSRERQRSRPNLSD